MTSASIPAAAPAELLAGLNLTTTSGRLAFRKRVIDFLRDYPDREKERASGLDWKGAANFGYQRAIARMWIINHLGYDPKPRRSQS